jgi:3-oxoacyl-[acyl-carrier protein] reductase
MESLAGKAALVTGAQQGIGRAIVLAFAAAGADVAINYLDDRSAADDVARRVRAMGRRATIIACDVASIAATAAMVETACRELGRIDVLVNNAGIFPRVAFVAMTGDDWDNVMNVNLRGAFFCAQAAVRSMIAAGRPGNVVNIGSRAMMGASAGSCHYAASKGGLASLTRAMAIELAPYRIRVNAIAPGLVDTAQPRSALREDQIQARVRETPAGRIGQPEDIATAAVFLASDASSFIVGQTLHANGGSYLA